MAIAAAQVDDKAVNNAQHNKPLTGHGTLTDNVNRATRWRGGTSDIGAKPVAAMPVRSEWTQ